MVKSSPFHGEVSSSILLRGTKTSFIYTMQYIVELIEQQKRNGNIDKAMFLSESALKQDPNNIQLLYISALLYADIGFYASSISLYQKILEIDGTHKDALFDLAAVLFQSGSWKEALSVADKLIAIDPYYKRISMHTANALCLMGEWHEAMLRYKKDISNKKEDVTAWSDMLLSMNYVDIPDEERFLYYTELYNSLQKPNERLFDVPTEIINIGYVSSDFRNHAVAYFTKGVLPHHTKEKFNVFFYHNSMIEDNITELFKTGGKYKQVAHLTDDQLIQEIIDDNIHILVDLNGHTRGNRLGVFLQKPAPIQISWLGFLNTIGMPAIEHKIVHTSMNITNEFYTETIHPVSNSLYYSSPEDCPRISEQPFLSNKFITYGCFNNPRKIGTSVLTTWDTILSQKKESILKLLTTGDSRQDQKILNSFSGENKGRIQFQSERDTLHFMELISTVDICLDPFPHSGGATTGHSLWMGVPVITLKGSNEFQNISSAILHDVGLSLFAVSTVDEYIALATAILPDDLIQLRKTMRQRFNQIPNLSVQSLESLYQDLIHHHKSL